jgi:phospholipid/cholesterol/gamma-HCH transport system ATP-binding protein
MKLIETLNDVLKLTSIVVSHDVAEVTSIADYCYVLSGGKVMAAGTPEELQQNSSEQVNQFLEGRPDGPVKFHFPAADYKEDLMESAIQ